MIPNDAEIAALCAGLYRYNGEPAVVFDRIDEGEDDGICWALKHLPDHDVVVFRGSVTSLDWARDLFAIPVPTRVGSVHAGFFAGMEHMWRDLRPLLRQPVIVTGHSLGAARATILTALMVADGIRPVRRVVLGEPRAGFKDLAEIVKQIDGASYCNSFGSHHDLVCDVPIPFPDIPFTHPTPLVRVSAPPLSGDRWGLFAYHHIELYVAALRGQAKETAA